MSLPKYPMYKDSGVNWLGDIPEHWSLKKLKFSCDVFPSNVDKKTYEDQEAVSLCNYTDVYYNDEITRNITFMDATASDEQIKKFTLRAGDTIITKDSEMADDIGIAAYVPEDLESVICGYHLSMIRPRKNMAGLFVKRFFESHYLKSTLAVQANGLTRVGLSQYSIDNLLITLPPLQEQTLIAQFLDRETAKIDDLIAEQEKLITLLDEKRQAMISHAVTKGLNPNAPMKDSSVKWLGEVPKSWDVMQLKHLCTLLKDGTHTPPARVDDGIPLLSVRNISNGVFDLKDDDSLISIESYKELCRSFLPQPNDVLLAIVGATLGKSAIIPANLGEFHIQRSVAIFRPINSIQSKWMHYCFSSEGFQRLLWEYAGFSAQPGIYLGTLSSFKLSVPALLEQTTIVAYLDQKTAQLDTLKAEALRGIDLLKERRSALISAAVTGKIDVRHAVTEQVAI